MDQQEVNKLKRQWEESDEAVIDKALGALLDHADGRKFVWWLLKIGQVGTQPMGNNALGTAFNCGSLNVGQQILDRVTLVSPEGYIQTMKEMASEQRNRDRELRELEYGRRNSEEFGE